ncbi:hypothetical protein A8M32_00235 [Sinorhizobium alkalisoli]|uniref:6-carboxy-5,6,7,8-tetrahydropterin synthase n=2 Tax=Sinorhizobium alkalisoli TaxID=1752398 RepID=A0A1E3VID7_9HYPH|nr:hypothetical protein A8M32_00235 [Sinorhizobium alkalisoli]QFI70628.1 Queuosine biosynthesis QueD, PTPS-I [Sinorhizobium alkalisoli]
MVLDFGFLKTEMMGEIDACCDHGMMIWVDDPWIASFLPFTSREASAEVMQQYRAEVRETGQKLIEGPFGKTLLLSQVPTAENLAKHWFRRLAPRVRLRSGNRADLLSVVVWETPNCMATYHAPDLGRSRPGLSPRHSHSEKFPNEIGGIAGEGGNLGSHERSTFSQRF